MRRVAAFLLVLVSLGANAAHAGDAGFTAEEKLEVLAHGPWPPERTRDPRNPVSGRIEAVAFGERLFYEPRLSGTGSVLCATCHAPFRRFQDARPRAFGLEETERNTPTLLNVRFYRRFGWEGANDQLAVQSIRPLLEPREMRSSAAHVAAFIRGDPSFLSGYRKTFRRDPPASDEDVLADVGQALAAFQETLVSSRAPFDDFRDSLDRGDPAGMNAYPEDAKRGLRIFVGKGGCDACHSGALFTSGALAGHFRIPGLRNVALTAPYMHDGSLATLREAVKSHSGLADGEVEDLVSFLRTLTDAAR